MADIVERPIVPHNPSPTKAIQKEQYNLFAPAAANGKIGMAGYNPEQFDIKDQMVSLATRFLSRSLTQVVDCTSSYDINRKGLIFNKDGGKSGNVAYLNFTHRVVVSLKFPNSTTDKDTEYKEVTGTLLVYVIDVKEEGKTVRKQIECLIGSDDVWLRTYTQVIGGTYDHEFLPLKDYGRFDSLNTYVQTWAKSQFYTKTESNSKYVQKNSNGDVNIVGTLTVKELDVKGEIKKVNTNVVEGDAPIAVTNAALLDDETENAWVNGGNIIILGRVENTDDEYYAFGFVYNKVYEQPMAVHGIYNRTSGEFVADKTAYLLTTGDDTSGIFVTKVTTPNVLYGTDADGNQIKYYANSYDDDNHIPSKEPWSNIIPTKEFVKARNPTYQHGFTPTVKQYGKKDMKGWYRIAERTFTTSGEGHAGNLFKVHCYIYGAGDCDIVFLVDQADWNAKPSISVLSYAYRSAKVITDIRVAYPKSAYKKDTLGYIDVYVDVNPTVTGFDSDRAIMFRTEELFYNSTRRWAPIYPRVVRDFVKGGSVDGIRVENGVLVDTERLPNGKKSNDAYPNYGYHTFYTKSAVDFAWSDVTLSTSYINQIPDRFAELSGSMVDINDVYSIVYSATDGLYGQLDYIASQVQGVPSEFAWVNVEDGFYNMQALFENAYKYRFTGKGDWYNSGGRFAQYFDFEVLVVPIGTPIAAGEGSGVPCKILRMSASTSIPELSGSEVSLHTDTGFIGYSVDPTYRTFSLSLLCDFSIVETNLDGTNSYTETGEVYLYSLYVDGFQADGEALSEAYIAKTPQTELFFPSTMGLREESLKRQLMEFSNAQTAAVVERLKNREET